MTAQVKLIKIFKRICPDIILANNLIDKLKTRDKYETYSISIKPGIISTGTPGGKNRLKYCSWCIHKAIRLLPKKKASAKNKVSIKWLVLVELYGIIPTRLLKKIYKKTV
jgi:hypothetical protein